MDVTGIFLNFKACRNAIIKALTTDVEMLYEQCDPKKECLCLYGFSNQNWELKLPAEEVPSELPEPTLGINFLRDLALVEDWLHVVAVLSDAWLLAVAFFYVGKFRFGKADRKLLFKLINELPTVDEVVRKHPYVNPNVLNLTRREIGEEYTIIWKRGEPLALINHFRVSLLIQYLLNRRLVPIEPKDTQFYTIIKPLGGRVLIKVKEGEEKTQTMPLGNGVVAVGEGKTVEILLPTNAQTCLKPGAHILYAKYAGTEVQLNGQKHLIVKDEDIVGILETDDIKDLKPFNDRVLIKVEKVEEKVPGGLFLTETTKEKPFIGTVMTVGPKLMEEKDNRKHLSVAPGNTVLCSKYTGKEIKGKDGFDYVPLRSSDVMAILS